MSDPTQPTFLVSADNNPVAVCINGKANYLNCNTFREFVEMMMKKGTAKFILNFANCKGMDSTFLGILAGTALELRKKSPPGALIITELSQKNFDLIKNLGLHHLLTIRKSNPDADKKEDKLSSLKDSEVSSASEVLKAHENLASANSDNVTKFQDVISFLRSQVKDGEKGKEQ